MICRRRAWWLAAFFLVAACERDPTELRLISPPLPMDREIAQSLATLLAQNDNFQLTLTSVPQTGEAALDALLAGEADLALVLNYLPYRADVAAVMPLYPSVLHIGYRAGRDVTDAYTLLNNARVYAGEEGSSSRLMLERIVDRLHMPRDAFSYVERTTGGNLDDVDVIVVFAPISAQNRDQLAGFKLFSLGQPEDIGNGSIVDAAALLNPTLRPFVIPASTYGDANLAAVVTVAADKMLVTRNDMDPAIVYDLVNEIRRLRPALAANSPGLFDQFDDSFDVSRSTFVVHTGTQDFLQRDEPTMYERYSGVAEVLVTLLIALASAGLAGVRILKRRRKNRIDRFYADVIRIRNSVTAESSAADRARARQQLCELQQTAFDQLIAEQLAADESFQIFITLSNDVLEQLQ
ncbi:MAG: hypothetical protein OEW64_02590 [Gammaproteobacteria bacterium]|nr:hypothetical protein [Gammaproteobacteria bacterium]MDH5302967.1 hypothetical protein [Gammaproteobacteria bacterium]